MANEQNLTQAGKPLTREEAQRRGSLGGKASVKKRRERKAMREQLEILLAMPVKNPKVKEQLKKLGINSKEIDNQMAITIALYQEALKGNTKAYELIRDTIGEKPIDKVENINPPVINVQRPNK